MLLARQVKLQPQKKWMVFGTTALMSVLFLLLTWLFFMGFAERKAVWMPFAFLVIYAAFFVCIGLNQLAFTTLQGKLVEANQRGRLLLVANTVGAVSAVLCAFVLLSRWLSDEHPRFDLIFGFSGVLFGLSAVTMLFLIEPKDSFQQAAAAHPMHYFADAYRVLVEDRNFRLLALVATLFGVSFMLFPHYQSLGLQTMHLPTRSLMWWVIIQNMGTGLVSIPIGSIADRYGNRLGAASRLAGHCVRSGAGHRTAAFGESRRPALRLGLRPRRDDAGRAANAAKLHAGNFRPRRPRRLSEHAEPVHGRSDVSFAAGRILH